MANGELMSGERFSVVLPHSWVAGASSTVLLTGLL